MRSTGRSRLLAAPVLAVVLSPLGAGTAGADPSIRIGADPAASAEGHGALAYAARGGTGRGRAAPPVRRGRRGNPL